MKVKIGILLMSLAVGNCAFSNATSNLINLPIPPIQQIIQERVNKGYNVGVVVAVITPNGTEFYNYGTTSKLPIAKAVDANTQFPIASVTKVFTTLLFAEAIKNNSLPANAAAQDYLPVTVHLPEYQGQKITLAQLATHYSGLPTHPTDAPSNNPYANYNIEKMAEFLKDYKLQTPPGAHYNYSDIGIGLLGEVLANKTGIDYASLLSTHITQPLQMNDTKINAWDPTQQAQVTGYDATEHATAPMAYPILPGGGAIYSTANDLAKFVAANLGFTKTDLYPAMQLSHIIRHPAGQAINDVDFPGKEQLAIALGWNVDMQHQLVWKNGNMPGYSSFVGLNLAKKIGVVILTNTGNVTYTDNIGLHLLDPTIKLFPIYQEAAIDKNILNDYAGKYQLPDGSLYWCAVEDNHLQVAHLTNDKTLSTFNIYPKSNTEFFGKISNTIFTFQSNPNATNNLIIAENGEKISAVRME